MARVRYSVQSKKSRRAVLKLAKGYYGNKSRSWRAANEQVMHSGNYAFRDRRARKRQFRKLWIQRINAACRENGTTYSRFMHDMRSSGIEIDRKILADIAVSDPAAFTRIMNAATASEADSEVHTSDVPAHPEAVAAAGTGISDSST